MALVRPLGDMSHMNQRITYRPSTAPTNINKRSFPHKKDLIHSLFFFLSPIIYNILEQHKNKLISIPNTNQLNTAYPYSNYSRQTNNYTVVSINKTFCNISFNDIGNLNIILYTWTNIYSTLPIPNPSIEHLQSSDCVFLSHISEYWGLWGCLYK